MLTLYVPILAKFALLEKKERAGKTNAYSVAKLQTGGLHLAALLNLGLFAHVPCQFSIQLHF